MALVPVETSILPMLNADRKKALNRQRKREELLNFDTGNKILNLHGNLNELADELDKRVEKQLEDNENKYFVAYNNFMFDVLKQINELKQKADVEETKTRRDAKIQSLEKELDWFMNEALRLDELCKQYKKELDKWKGKADSLEDDRSFLENQIKTAKRNNKTLRGAVEKAQTSAYSALVSADEGKQLPPTIPQQEAIQGPEPVLALEDASGFGVNPGGLSRELEERYQIAVKRLKEQLQTEQKLAAKLRASGDRQFGEPSPLEGFFVDCVEQVKDTILERRQTAAAQGTGPRGTAPARAARSGKAPPPAAVDRLSRPTLADFTVTDRRQVVELLMSSEQVLQFLYDKLFPPAVGSPAHYAADVG